MSGLSFINVDAFTAHSDAKENRRRVRSHVSKRNNIEKQVRKQRQRNPCALHTIQPRSDDCSLPTPRTADVEDDLSLSNARKTQLRKRHTRRATWGLSEGEGSRQGAETIPTSKLIHISNTPEQQSLMRVIYSVQIPYVQTMALNTGGHTRLHIWGKYAGPEHAWHPDLGIDEDHPLIRASRCFAISYTSDHTREGTIQSLDTLYYQGETMRLIQEEVNRPGEDISNELIVTMLLVALIASGQCDPKLIALHTDAVWRCIHLRGGLESFPLPLRRLFIWICDIVRRALDAFTRPVRRAFKWPTELTIDTDCEPLPEDLAQTALICEEATLANMPSHIKLPSGVIFSLHILGLSSSEGMDQYDQHPAISNSYWYLMRCMTETYSIIEEPGEFQDEPNDVVFIIRAFSDCATLFTRATYASNASNPFHAFYSIYFKTLLESTGGGIPLWARNDALKLLLWILCTYMCNFNFSEHSVVQAWYLSAIHAVVEALDIEEGDDFENVVTAFPWTTKYGANACQWIWDKAMAIPVESGTALTLRPANKT